METCMSRVFVNGNSQAVRIPAAFRLEADRVCISRQPNGDLLLHPVPARRGDALLAVLQGLDGDFAAAVEEGRSAAPPLQEREPL